MDLAAFERQLRQEGFRQIYVWQDGAHAFYPDHTHPMDTAHIILEGEMTLRAVAPRTPTRRANALRTFRLEPSTRPEWGCGCRYLIGEK